MQAQQQRVTSIVLVLLCCLVATTWARQDVSQPPLRSTLTKNQLIGEPTSKAATSLRTWIVDTMRSFSRLSVYNIEKNAAAVEPAVKQPTIESTTLNQNQKLIGWAQVCDFVFFKFYN